MVVSCTQCQTKFRVDDSKIGARGVKVRCSKCQNTFVVKPEAVPAAVEAAPPPQLQLQLEDESPFETHHQSAGPVAPPPTAESDLIERNTVDVAPAARPGPLGSASPFDLEDDVTLPNLGEDLAPKVAADHLSTSPFAAQPGQTMPAPVSSEGWQALETEPAAASPLQVAAPPKMPVAAPPPRPPPPVPMAPPPTVSPPVAPPPMVSPPMVSPPMVSPPVAPPPIAPPMVSPATPAPPAPGLALGDDLFDLSAAPPAPAAAQAPPPADTALNGLPSFGSDDEAPSFEGGIGSDGAVTKAPAAAPARTMPSASAEPSLEVAAKPALAQATQRSPSRSDLAPPPPPRIRMQIALWVVMALAAASLVTLWWSGGAARFVLDSASDAAIRVDDLSVGAYPTLSPAGALWITGVVTNTTNEASKPLRLALLRSDGKKVTFVPGQVFNAMKAYREGEFVPMGDAVVIAPGGALSFKLALQPSALDSSATPAIEPSYE